MPSKERRRSGENSTFDFYIKAICISGFHPGGRWVLQENISAPKIKGGLERFPNSLVNQLTEDFRLRTSARHQFETGCSESITTLLMNYHGINYFFAGGKWRQPGRAKKWEDSK